MHRLARYDVSRRFQRASTRLISQLLFGASCAALMVVSRTVLDVWAPTVGPFALVYPTVLLATLYGHWQAGILAYAITFGWAWYVVLPTVNSFNFEIETDFSRVSINALAALVVLIFAETFRRAVAEAMMQRDVEIRRREVLLKELDHRTRNNFALVVSLLEMQQRSVSDPALSAALDQAITRVNSFSRAYANLSDSQGEGAMVEMQPYLFEVVERVSAGAFHKGVQVNVNSVNCELPREVAVAIGLFANEALTNCAKYAFPHGRAGQIRVSFAGEADNWQLEISDNGVGNSPTPGNGASSRIGEKLLQAFAHQASAQIQLTVSDHGRAIRLVSAPD